MMEGPAIRIQAETMSGPQAEDIAKMGGGGLKEDDPPFLRFEESDKEDRNASLTAGRMVRIPIVMVYIRARGDTKSEVPDVVEGWAFEERMIEKQVKRMVERHEDDGKGGVKIIEREISEVLQVPFQYKVKTTPWFDKLKEKLHNNFISQNYYDYCLRAFNHWKENHTLPVEGTPVSGWNQISMAMQKNLIDLGFTTIEATADMNEEAMGALGIGSREVKSKAKAYTQTTAQGQASTELANAMSENEQLKAQMSGLADKMHDLELRAKEQEKQQEPEKANKRTRRPVTG